MKHWRWYSKVLLALALLAFAYWVWPTPWSSFRTTTAFLPDPKQNMMVKAPNGWRIEIRENRLTHRVQYRGVLCDGEWLDDLPYPKRR